MMGYRTLNVDRIAKDGAVFTDWYASINSWRPAITCGPSLYRAVAAQRICGPPDYDRVSSANVRSRSVSRSITPSRATSTSLRVTLSLSS
ncbi:MAG TPA: hypothetical protein DCL72_07230 [Rhizobiales bacterium]|nr:hypothetical protein [Hyphomicrobiales bacterium]HAN64025.1 hypothetical protein [Hyphomicrobiales bacterium]